MEQYRYKKEKKRVGPQQLTQPPDAQGLPAKQQAKHQQSAGTSTVYNRLLNPAGTQRHSSGKMHPTDKATKQAANQPCNPPPTETRFPQVQK